MHHPSPRPVSNRLSSRILPGRSSSPSRAWTGLFLDDYEVQVCGGLLSPECRLRLEEAGCPGWLPWMLLDSALCYLLLQPLVVAFWRSAWYAAAEVSGRAFQVREGGGGVYKSKYSKFQGFAVVPHDHVCLLNLAQGFFCVLI